MARQKKPGKYKYLNVSLPEELTKKIDLLSEKTRIPKTALVEMALEEYVKDKDL